ncbi:hypothetical protein CERSUDRAFT_74895 [Gelatoporia subvermispora B]|uniref:DUF6532 domain-containing protein n=1 Tax=Ceriporiopsis subvermispora (strain B) TaxID=914234 RepID=M2QT89_CERS8|nr:hypothetical protein CERSUDRAFT_74895 [Gelatoporia subvermispora B]
MVGYKDRKCDSHRAMNEALEVVVRERASSQHKFVSPESPTKPLELQDRQKNGLSRTQSISVWRKGTRAPKPPASPLLEKAKTWGPPALTISVIILVVPHSGYNNSSDHKDSGVLHNPDICEDNDIHENDDDDHKHSFFFSLDNNNDVASKCRRTMKTCQYDGGNNNHGRKRKRDEERERKKRVDEEGKGEDKKKGKAKQEKDGRERRKHHLFCLKHMHGHEDNNNAKNATKDGCHENINNDVHHLKHTCVCDNDLKDDRPYSRGMRGCEDDAAVIYQQHAIGQLRGHGAGVWCPWTPHCKGHNEYERHDGYEGHDSRTNSTHRASQGSIYSLGKHNSHRLSKRSSSRHGGHGEHGGHGGHGRHSGYDGHGLSSWLSQGSHSSQGYDPNHNLEEPFSPNQLGLQCKASGSSRDPDHDDYSPPRFDRNDHSDSKTWAFASKQARVRIHPTFLVKFEKLLIDSTKGLHEKAIADHIDNDSAFAQILVNQVQTHQAQSRTNVHKCAEQMVIQAYQLCISGYLDNKDLSYLFPLNDQNTIDTVPPYQHPAIIKVIHLAYFTGNNSLAALWAEDFKDKNTGVMCILSHMIALAATAIAFALAKVKASLLDASGNYKKSSLSADQDVQIYIWHMDVLETIYNHKWRMMYRVLDFWD